MTPEEQVLVVPRPSVVADLGWRGIRIADLADVLAVVEAHGRFLPRGQMEGDESFKQVIPYVVLRDGDGYFLMRRTRAGADRRLHDLWSIGIGGHVNPDDGTVASGLRREWAEELEAAFVPDFQFVGLLNDDSTAVGRVHVGLVFEAEAGGQGVAIREKDKLEGRFASRAEVAAVADGMETWSRLAFDHLEARGAG